jgi:hypothetical protein
MTVEKLLERDQEWMKATSSEGLQTSLTVLIKGLKGITQG